MQRNVTLFASEVAALLGYNRFVDSYDAWDKVLKRNFPFLKEKKVSKEKTDLKKAVAEVAKTVSFPEKVTAVEKEEILVKAVVDKLPEIQNTTVAVAGKEAVEIVSVTKEVARTMHGIETEKKGLGMFLETATKDAAIAAAEAIKDVSVAAAETTKVSLETECAPRVKQVNDVFRLYGVIDGMMDDDTVVEHKARISRFFYKNKSAKIYKYELTQVQLYMYLYDKKKAVLVETHEGETNSRDIDLDTEWLEAEVFCPLGEIAASGVFDSIESVTRFYETEKPRTFF